MNEIMTEDVKKYMSFIVMLLVAVLAVLAVGEICKYILPKDTVFFLTIDKLYFVAAGSLLLTAGLNKLNLDGLRNLAALFVGLTVLDVVLYFLDKLLCSALWGASYTSIMQRIPEQYFGMYYNALIWLSVILAAGGLLLLLVKSLDMLKDVLSGTKKA
jgi:membrane protein DedA with SNARE-associated domain